jgi:hypothetical protein
LQPSGLLNVLFILCSHWRVPHAKRRPNMWLRRYSFSQWTSLPTGPVSLNARISIIVCDNVCVCVYTVRCLTLERYLDPVWEPSYYARYQNPKYARQFRVYTSQASIRDSSALHNPFAALASMAKVERHPTSQFTDPMQRRCQDHKDCARTECRCRCLLCQIDN